jgi:hypothetical protein
MSICPTLITSDSADNKKYENDGFYFNKLVYSCLFNNDQVNFDNLRRCNSPYPVRKNYTEDKLNSFLVNQVPRKTGVLFKVKPEYINKNLIFKRTPRNGNPNFHNTGRWEIFKTLFVQELANSINNNEKLIVKSVINKYKSQNPHISENISLVNITGYFTDTFSNHKYPILELDATKDNPISISVCDEIKTAIQTPQTDQSSINDVPFYVIYNRLRLNSDEAYHTSSFIVYNNKLYGLGLCHNGLAEDYTYISNINAVIYSEDILQELLYIVKDKSDKYDAAILKNNMKILKVGLVTMDMITKIEHLISNIHSLKLTCQLSVDRNEISVHPSDFKIIPRKVLYSYIPNSLINRLYTLEQPQFAPYLIALLKGLFGFNYLSSVSYLSIGAGITHARRTSYEHLINSIGSRTIYEKNLFDIDCQEMNCSSFISHIYGINCNATIFSLLIGALSAAAAGYLAYNGDFISALAALYPVAAAYKGVNTPYTCEVINKETIKKIIEVLNNENSTKLQFMESIKDKKWGILGFGKKSKTRKNKNVKQIQHQKSKKSKKLRKSQKRH